MNRFDKSTEVIHDLLLIQNERKALYEKIVKWPGHEESVRNHMKKVIMQCRNSIMELRRHIDMTGSDPADRVDIRGEIYRDWPGLSGFVPGNSRVEMIVSLENSEKTVVLAYQKALQCEDHLGEELKTMINDQLSLVHRSFNYIQERKEKPFEPAAISEEDKPFLLSRERVFIQSTVHSRLIDLFE